MTDWIYFAPNPDSYGKLRFKIVTALVPSCEMLGKQHLVVSARRLPESHRWEIRYVSKRWYKRWPKFPILNKGMSQRFYLGTLWFVREALILADDRPIDDGYLGDDCMVVGHGMLDTSRAIRDAEIGNVLRKVWYLSLDDPLDGVDRQPDASCVSPRGHSLAYRHQPRSEQIEGAKKRHADYLFRRGEKAAGKIEYLGMWLTPEEYKATREFEKQNIRR